MNKNERKVEKAIVKALASACEALQFQSRSFRWLTHFVDYANVPQSLKIVYVFETNASLESDEERLAIQSIPKLTDARLNAEGIFVQCIDTAIVFDTLENGADASSARWCRKYADR